MLWGIAISPDGSKVYAANGGNIIDVMDTSNNTIIKTININGSPRDIAISPDGKYAYVTNNTGNKVAVIDTGSYNVLTQVPVDISPAGIAITPDGKRVYVANNGGSTVSVIDTTTNTVIKTVNVGAQPFGIAASPDGREVCVTNNAGASVSTIDVATNSVINTISTRASPGGIAIYSKPAQPIISPNIVSFTATPSESNSAPFIVYFNGSATQGDAANMHWDFGDGRTIDSIHKDATVADSYDAAGTYTVTLTATYRDASTNNTSQSVSVAAVPHKPINADFVGSPLVGTSSLNVQFTDKSTGANNWFYAFGDKGNAIAQNPTHLYTAPG